MIKLKNQFIMPPLKLGYANGDGQVNQKHFKFYKERSRNIGAIALEPLYLDKGLREIPNQLGIDADDKIHGLTRLVNLLHDNGSKAIAHLSHPGRMANPKIPDNYFWSASAKACENGGAVPEVMSYEMMVKAVKLFTDAAKRAVQCGFDMIELQFGHGYLLAQFLSPSVNQRDDAYNGTLENRMRFPLEILDAVKESVDIPVIARISGDEMMPEGFHLEDMVLFSKLLEKRGVAAIHVSAGSVCSTPPWFFQHMFIPKGKIWEFAEKIKKEVNIPTIFVGQVNTIEDIENLYKNYNADYIAIGRALVADPDFLGKYYNKNLGNIRPCLACADGCLGSVRAGEGLQCVVNPKVGKEIEEETMAIRPKEIAVIGGGLAGMEASLTLTKRGHHVTLFEKNKLGGQFNLASLAPQKQSLNALVLYYINELKDNKIKILYKEAKETDLVNLFDKVIIATGSVPSVPKIDGLDNYYWADILLKENLPENKKILIIGGGLIGVDIATALISLNNKIIIVKRTTDFGEEMEMIAKMLSLKMMKEKGTVFSDHTKINSIEGKTVFAERNGENIQFNDIDAIVVSTGMKSYIPFKYSGSAPVYLVGDANKVGKAQDAIYSTYELALTL